MIDDTDHGWAATIEVASPSPAAPTDFDDLLVNLLEELVEHAGAVSCATARDRYGATFSVDVDEADPATAFIEARAIFTAASGRAGLPAWPIVRLELLTVAEQEAELARPVIPELVGVAEVADIIGVSRQRASKLAQQRNFPDPIARLASGPVWTRPSLNHFLDEWTRKPGRPALPLDADEAAEINERTARLAMLRGLGAGATHEERMERRAHEEFLARAIPAQTDPVSSR